MANGRYDALKVLDKLDECYLECDGLTTVISSLLSTAEVYHKVFVGRASHSGGRRIAPHLWVELEDGTVIDYRLRMWLGNLSVIPHGIFNPDEYPDVHYDGQERSCYGPRDAVALILCMTANIDFDKMLNQLKSSLVK